MNIIGLFSVITAAILFGLIPTFTKISYNYGANPEIAIISRYILACIIITIPIIFVNIKFSLIKKNIFLLLLISAGSISLTMGLLTAVIYIPVSLVALIFYTYPLIVLAYNNFFMNKLTKLQIIGFFSAFIGLAIALGPSFENLKIYGILLAFTASIGAATILITNEILARSFSAIVINGFVNFVCLAFFTLIIFLKFDINIPESKPGWFFIIFASSFYCIAFFSQLIAVKKIGSVKTSLLLYLEPLTAIVSAIVLLNESLSILQLFGTFIVLLSLIVTSLKST